MKIALLMFTMVLVACGSDEEEQAKREAPREIAVMNLTEGIISNSVEVDFTLNDSTLEIRDGEYVYWDTIVVAVPGTEPPANCVDRPEGAVVDIGAYLAVEVGEGPYAFRVCAYCTKDNYFSEGKTAVWEGF
jgi:hypothetical protein